MHRALRPLVALVALASFACARPKPAIFAGTGSGITNVAETDPCRGSAEPLIDAPSPLVPSVEPPWGARVVRVELDGAPSIPRALLTSAITTKPSMPLDQAAIARDVRALHELEAIDTVRADVEQLPNDEVVVRYLLGARRTIGDVVYRWKAPLTAGHWVPLAKGELYDPARIARMRFDLERNLVDEGHRDASVEERHILADEKVRVCFLVEPRTKYLVDRIAFTGNDHVAQAELLALVQTHEDRVNEPGKPLREDLLENDLLFVSALYYDRGYLSVKVGPAQTKTKIVGENGQLSVEIPIVEGAQYRIKTLRFSGFGPAATHGKLMALKPGEVFGRAKVMDGIEKIKALHRKNGVEVDVTPETTLDAPKGEVDVVFKVEQVKK